MPLKKTLIASILSAVSFAAIALFSTTAVQAQETRIRTLKDYLNNCIPEDESDEDLPEECDRLKEARESKKENNRPREAEKTGGIGGYAGVVLGVLFPDIDEDRPVFAGENVDLSTGFGSSIFGGIKFNRYFGTDIELSGFAGEIDSDLDEDQYYFMSGAFLNPRFTLPLNDSKNSLALFLSPGIGVSQLSASVEDEVSSDLEDDDDDFDRTTIIEDDSRFTWQIKGGVSIPVSSKFSIIPQVRYASQTGDNAASYFGTEVGVRFDF